MKFAVQLKGSKPLFENVAPCFQGGFARIKKSETTGFWNLPHSTIAPLDPKSFRSQTSFSV